MSFGPAVPFRLPVPRGKQLPQLPGRGSKGEREAIILPGKDVGNGKSGKFRCFVCSVKALKNQRFLIFPVPVFCRFLALSHSAGLLQIC